MIKICKSYSHTDDKKRQTEASGNPASGALDAGFRLPILGKDLLRSEDIHRHPTVIVRIGFLFKKIKGCARDTVDVLEKIQIRQTTQSTEHSSQERKRCCLAATGASSSVPSSEAAPAMRRFRA